MLAKVLPCGCKMHGLESAHNASKSWFQVHTLESSAPFELRALDRLVDALRARFRSGVAHELGAPDPDAPETFDPGMEGKRRLNPVAQDEALSVAPPPARRLPVGPWTVLR